jgi:phosphoribosylformylglycinamidine synthase
MRVAVIRFPGSNCDVDTLRAAAESGADAYFVWHRDRSLDQADVVMLPGGFAYGDHLRAGAIARFSPIMNAVRDHALAGGPTLGICNGFQVLCEAGLLPGALVRNAEVKFLSRPVSVRVEATDTPFTSGYREGAIFDVPVAHGEGRFVAPSDVVDRLEAEREVVLRYVGENPNGSVRNIAGITNQERNVVGMMPHPERASDALLGVSEGSTVFRSVMQHAAVLGGGAR